MANGTEPYDSLELLVGMHGVSLVLEQFANVLSGTGSVCSGILREVAAIETWLQRRQESGVC